MGSVRQVRPVQVSALSPGSSRLRGAGLSAQRRTAREEGVPRPERVPRPESAGGRAPAAPTLAVLPAGSRTPAPRLHAREPWGCARRFGPKVGPIGPRLRQAPGGATGTARLQVFCSLLVDKPLGFRTASPPNPGVQSSSPPPAPHPALEPSLA